MTKKDFTTIDCIKLSWREGEYKVDKPGDMSGEYVSLEDFQNILNLHGIGYDINRGAK